MPTTCPDDQTPETLPLMARSPNETRPTQFRLSDETLSGIDEIAAHHGLETRAAVLRFLVKKEQNAIGKLTPRPKGRPRKNA